MTNVTSDMAPFGAGPPKPIPTLRVGITGHRPRPAVFPTANFEFVRRRLSTVFATIGTDLSEAAAAQSDLYADAPPRVRLVSALAEGADQLAVEAMPRDWTLDAILPLPEEAYLDDFRRSAVDGETDVRETFLKHLGRAGTVLALPDDAGARPRDRAYARLGGFLLRQIDLLVAVWNGRPEAGRGGTAEVVRTALDAGIPVVWIRSDVDRDPRMIVHVDDDGEILAPDADCLKGTLREAIEGIVGLPQRGGGRDEDEHGITAVDRLGRFFGETWPSWTIYGAYALFERLLARRLPFPIVRGERQSDYSGRWRPLSERGPIPDPLDGRTEAILLPRFAWADALAVNCSHHYRSIYFLSYVLAAVAVLIAVLGSIHAARPDVAHSDGGGLLFAALELLTIGFILAIVVSGRRMRWKERWMEYRTLAELLQNVRFLAFLGEHGRAHRLSRSETAPTPWCLWYLRATMREIGLPNATLDGAYQRRTLVAVDEHVLSDQDEWHRRNATVLHRMDAFLRWAGITCFASTLIYLALLATLTFVEINHLFGVDSGHQGVLAHLRGWLETYELCAGALLPAAGAAFAGIRETGDFRKVAEHSAKTAAALRDLHDEIDQAKRTLTLDESGDTLLSTARVLSEDLAAWQSVYGHKRLELPA